MILSSEWDYIPFAYPQTLEDFPTFTLIGLPASEGSNILILPLAGHELGHSVWSHEELDEDLYDELMDLIEQEYSLNITEFGISVPEYYKAGLEDDLVLEDCKQNTIEYAMKHVEEIFCDLFGLLLFGESYLRAFVYILAPSMGTRPDHLSVSCYPKRWEGPDGLHEFGDPAQASGEAGDLGACHLGRLARQMFFSAGVGW